jgi:hypothetical protein
MEDENRQSPSFGIPVLKRLSTLRTRYLPLSRETFNALLGTVVKSDFWLISSQSIETAARKASSFLENEEINRFAGRVLVWREGEECRVELLRDPRCGEKSSSSNDFAGADARRIGGIPPVSRKWALYSSH